MILHPAFILVVLQSLQLGLASDSTQNGTDYAGKNPFLDTVDEYDYSDEDDDDDDNDDDDDDDDSGEEEEDDSERECVGYRTGYPCMFSGGVLIQRRGQFGNSFDYFDKSFQDYRAGFGTCDKEYWIGLDTLHQMTRMRWTLNVVVSDGASNYSCQYRNFEVGAYPSYKLQISDFTSIEKLGDSMSSQNGAEFSAPDSGPMADKCAAPAHGGWWFSYKNCDSSNLNGENLSKQTHKRNIYWRYNNVQDPMYSWPFVWMYLTME